MSDMVDRLEALQTIRVGLEETCAHLTTQLFAAERRLKETEAAGAALIDPLFALGVELQRLRERVAELEEHVRKGDEFIGAVERAEKAERERDVARAEAAMLREALGGLLREEWMTYEGNLEATGHTSVDDLNAARTALAASPGDWLAAHDRAFAERVREACARTLFTCSSHTLEEAIEAKLPCAHQRQMTCIRAVDVDAIIKEATRG